MGLVFRRAGLLRGSGVVLLSRLVTESVCRARGAALFGARANSDWKAGGHRRQLPGRGLASRVAIFPRGGVGLLATNYAFAVFVLAAGARALRSPRQLAGHRNLSSGPSLACDSWHRLQDAALF